MPAKIGPDGKPIIVDSVPFTEEFDENDATAPFDANAARRRTDFEENDPTVPVSSAKKVSQGFTADLGIETVRVDVGDAKPMGSYATNLPDEDDMTQVFRRKSTVTQRESESAGSEVVETDAMRDPLVGWLVVVDGPGKGTQMTLGYGQNTIARTGGRVNLNFGDKEISRDCHVIVVFDPKSRVFFLSPGTGKALGYINDAPVLAPVVLNNGDEITLGATQLRFVSFCNTDFSWE